MKTNQWLWHRRALLGLKKRLLLRQHAELETAGEPMEPYGLHPADRATDDFDHDLALAQLSGDQGALYEIDDALRRLEQGTYGICEKTGRPIEPERLLAVPWTRFCTGAGQMAEQEAQASSPHLGRLSTARNRTPKTIGESGIRGQDDMPRTTR